VVAVLETTIRMEEGAVMRNLYKFIFDTGKVFFIPAKTKKRAITKFCQEYEISEEWVREHCRVLNMGAE
jgi:hypothetical protein